MAQHDIEESGGYMRNYIPQTERHDEETQLTPITRLRHVTAEDRLNHPYSVICQIAEDYCGADMAGDAEQTYSRVQSLMDARHDIWYNALMNNINPNWKTMRKDTKFEKFCREMLNIGDVPWNIKNKTPDIMFISENEHAIIIGDVSVTIALPHSEQHKTRKYSELHKFLSDRTTRQVTQFNFILREDLANLSKLIHDFKYKLGVLRMEYDYKKDMAMTESANMLIRLIEDHCTQRTKYNEKKEEGKYAKNKNYEPLDSLIFDEIKETKLPDCEPVVTEMSIIKMIKDEVERLGGASYYDTTIEAVNDAFNDVIESNESATITEVDGKRTVVEKRVKPPRSTLKVCDNSGTYSTKTDLELIYDYVQDIGHNNQDNTRDYFLSILPTTGQLNLMIKIKDKKLKKNDIKGKDEFTEAKVGGQYQYNRHRMFSNEKITKLNNKLKEGGEGNRNPKTAVAKLDLGERQNFVRFINDGIKYYGDVSNKPPVTDDSWDATTKIELDHTKVDRDAYDYVRKTNGVQLAHAMSALYNRISHLSAYASKYDNVFVPPNGSFIVVMPKNHTLVTNNNCDMPFIFITRAEKRAPLHHIEYEYSYTTDKYVYYVSKLCRLNTRVISCWNNASYRLIASASYLIAKSPQMETIKKEIVGLLTYLTLDVHQKVSEYMDLLKYIGFMPFADLHRLPHLIRDKCNLIMKTRMDVWMFERIRNFVSELSDIDKIQAKKPELRTCNGMPTRESFGMSMMLPSFTNPNVRHASPEDYIEELSVLNTSRPKHLYGSQFADASTSKTVEWNLEYDREVELYGEWATTGKGEGPYPFDAKYCFHFDAIVYATRLLNSKMTENANIIEGKIINGPYGDYMHNNCSLRGCTKDPSERENQTDLHTTSIAACFERYEADSFDEKKSKACYIGQLFALSDKRMEFSMSEKDQRGAGRPIATPTLETKACLMLIEKPEAAAGKYMPNNILVAGKDKLKEQHLAYTRCISDGIRMNLKSVYQLTEDQTKFSEMDNVMKCVPYILANDRVPQSAKKAQIIALMKLKKRIHLVKRLPKSVKENPMLMGECIDNNNTLGVQARIGWPQGMLNNISTSVHCAADYWITEAFKKAYPSHRNSIITSGLVHSDDSWVTVCCNNLATFKLFSLFRTIAKKMFCLKINEKKLWGGRYLGELVSNYNINGHVHSSTGKVICNGLSNLTYQNWAVDVSNQLSTLQQTLRKGGTLGNLILLSTLLRQQMIGAYHVTGLQLRLLYYLPIELGGYPRGSAYRLAVGGVHAHYADLHKDMTMTHVSPEEKSRVILVRHIIAAAVRMSKKNFTPLGNVDDANIAIDEDDYTAIEIPTKGEVFRAVKHLMPRSRKIARSVKVINRICAKFPSDGLALIVTKPATLGESIGHYGETAKSKQFELAAERYTQSSRKLATSQAMQSAGKVMKLNESPPLTFNEALNMLVHTNVDEYDNEAAQRAMSTDNEIVIACDTIVKTCRHEATEWSKGKVINRMPEIDNIYRTVSPLQDVLLKIIDRRCDTSYYLKYSRGDTSLHTLTSDMNDIENRFASYFTYYDDPKIACKLIMQGMMSTIKEKAFTQPRLSTGTVSMFLEDLYGAILDRDVVYRVHADKTYLTQKRIDRDTVHDIYTCIVLNEIYPNQVVIRDYKNMPIEDAITRIDYASLDYNTTLKHAICQKVINGTNDYLDKVVVNERFAYEWNVAQKYSIEKKYYGDWEVTFMYADIVCKVTSILGTITITTNKLDVKKILKGMRLMTMKCFSNYSYEYEMAWWGSRLWSRSNPPDQVESLFLCYHNNTSTTIRDSPNGTCIAIRENRLLRMNKTIVFMKPSDYKFEDNYRIVRGVMPDNDGNLIDFRVANVYQDFGLINPTYITLEPAMIEGFENFNLLRFNVLEDLTLNKRLSISRADTVTLLEENNMIDRKMILWRLFYHTYYFIKGMTSRMRPHTEHVAAEGMVIDLEDVGYSHLERVATTTKVESLDSIAVDLVQTLVKGSKKLHRPPNIARQLCKHLYDYSPMDMHLDYISLMIDDPTMYRWLTELKRVSDIQVEKINDQPEFMDFVGCDEDIIYFTYAYSLDLTKTWEGILRDTVNSRKRDQNRLAEVKPLIKMTLLAFNDNYIDDQIVTRHRTFRDVEFSDDDDYDI